MALKDTITTASILTSLNSFNFMIGAMLLQAFKKDDKYYLVTILSKSISPVECNYEIYDKKILVIICILEKWYHFLERALVLVKI